MYNRRKRPMLSATQLPQSVKKVTIRRKLITAVAIVAVCLFVTFHKGTAESGTKNSIRASSAAAQQQEARASFPVIDTSSFSATERRVLSILKQEYAKDPRSYDADVLRYTDGTKESWCADFISWVRYEAGRPYENLETGYWRIPGVMSLMDYYVASDAYYTVEDYTPKFGDVAFYFGETPDGSSREHVAFVVSVQGDTITTIGGNETNTGIVQIRTNALVAGERGLAGFGKSNLD